MSISFPLRAAGAPSRGLRRWPRSYSRPTCSVTSTCPPAAVEGHTVAGALGSVFADNPRLRGCVLDDQGALRRHVVVFVDGRPIRDRRTLSDPLPAGAEIFVMQALSGG